MDFALLAIGLTITAIGVFTVVYPEKVAILLNIEGKEVSSGQEAALKFGERLSGITGIVVGVFFVYAGFAS